MTEYNSYPTTPAQKKAYASLLRKAHADKKWAESKRHDKEWLANASDMSKSMLQDRLDMSAEELALKSYRYLKMRASAKQGTYIIDPSAGREWQKISGVKPRLQDESKWRFNKP